MRRQTHRAPKHALIEMVAEGEAELVIGSAPKHRYPLVCGPSSVHTSRETLRRGLANLDALASSADVIAAQSLG